MSPRAPPSLPPLSETCPLIHFDLHLLLFPAACLNPERHGGDGKEVSEERSQGEIFGRGGKGVTKSAARRKPHHGPREPEKDARGEARPARKHDRKRRIGRQILGRPRHPRVHPHPLIAILFFFFFVRIVCGSPSRSRSAPSLRPLAEPRLAPGGSGIPAAAGKSHSGRSSRVTAARRRWRKPGNAPTPPSPPSHPSSSSSSLPAPLQHRQCDGKAAPSAALG